MENVLKMSMCCVFLQLFLQLFVFEIYIGIYVESISKLIIVTGQSCY